MTETTSAVDSTANARTVEAFLYALQDQDFETFGASMADNIEWQNVGFPTIRGRDRIVKVFRRGEDSRFGFEVKFHRIAAEGNGVLTERTDGFLIGGRWIELPVMGAFEVEDGKIRAWRDYFDLATWTKQLQPSG